MSALRVANLVLRQTKGSPLTTAEGDQNWKTLRDFSNALADLIGVALNTDGTLKDNSVEESDIKDRSVTAKKMGLAALPFFADQGSPSNYYISPDPAPTEGDYQDGMVFFVRAAAGNTGPATLQVAGLDPKPIYKLGGQELSAGDILGRAVFAVAYFAGAFHLISGTGTSNSSSGGSSGGSGDTTASGSFSGILRYDPAAVAIPAFGTTKDFTHALNAIPDEYTVALQCVTAELGFTVGDSVPIELVVDAAGKPAFSVKVSASVISVRQLTNPAMVSRVNDGGTGHAAGTFENITAGNWNLKVTAGKITSTATQIFPALDFQVAQPNGAVSYGKDLFVFHSGSSRNYLSKIDIVTGNVTVIDNGSTVGKNIGATPIRMGGKDWMVFTSDKGVYKVQLSSPSTLATWGKGNQVTLDEFRPVAVEDTTTDSPQYLYCLPNIRSTDTDSGYGLTAVACKRVDMNAGSSATYGTKFSFADSGIVNSSAFSKFLAGNSEPLLLQYNPIKRRFYLIAGETGFIHILTIASGTFSTWWMSGAARAAALTYNKTIALPGGAGAWTNQDSIRHERFTVEFDLTTGQEKAIVAVRRLNEALTGVVSRCNWVE